MKTRHVNIRLPLKLFNSLAREANRLETTLSWVIIHKLLKKVKKDGGSENH